MEITIKTKGTVNFLSCENIKIEIDKGDQEVIDEEILKTIYQALSQAFQQLTLK